MRTLTDHKLNGLNEAITIDVLDEPGQGGACHEYAMSLNPIAEAAPNLIGEEKRLQRVSFQNGPIKESGVNGVSQEALVAILIDRLRSFQAGPYACRENAIALTHFEEALMWLQKRTRDRLARGVEGTNQK
jgi:hypothetical protein